VEEENQGQPANPGSPAESLKTAIKTEVMTVNDLSATAYDCPLN